MQHLSYFAYGSNMLRERLASRNVVLRDIGQAAWVEGYKLTFNKKSTDGSTKANLTTGPESIAWGVLFAIDPQSLDGLDEAEGAPHHYRRQMLITRTRDKTVEAMTYLAQPDKVLPVPDQPWDWYLALILAGAQACPGIPVEWIRDLRQNTNAKPYEKSASSQSYSQAVAQLKAAGHERWHDLLNTKTE
jgi:gamma-glutamylcyclotransferase